MNIKANEKKRIAMSTYGFEKNSCG